MMMLFQLRKVTSKIVYKCVVQKNKVTPVCLYTLRNKYNMDESHRRRNRGKGARGASGPSTFQIGGMAPQLF